MNAINYNGITIEVQTVTPEMAREVLDKHNSRNRSLSKVHAVALLNNMRKNTWRFNGDSICFDKNGELIDGQHRLFALTKFGQPLDFVVMKGFAPEVINTIDQEVKKRNAGDLLKMAGVPNYRDVASAIKKYFYFNDGRPILSAMRSSHGNDSKNVSVNFTVDDYLNEYMNNADFWDFVAVYSRACYVKTRLLQISDIGGIYAHLYKNKHHSDAEIKGFFDRLCIGGDDIKVIKLLRDLYIRDALSRNPMTSALRQTYLAKAWNYYIAGKEVSVLSYNPSKEGKIEFI